MNTSKQLWFTFAIIALLGVMGGCRTAQSTLEPAPAQVEGHYSYQHGWNYDIEDWHIDVHETGTMDFYPDGSALDSARQVYKVALNDGGSVTWVFNYVSPSRWRVEGEDFYFAGIEEVFRMEFLETNLDGCDESQVTEVAERILKNVRGNISRETKFHMAKLTDKMLVWSQTYRDGHTDTWEFYRINSDSKKDKH